MIRDLGRITLDNPDGVYNVGTSVTGTVKSPSLTGNWLFTVTTDDGQILQRSAAATNGISFSFAFNTPGYHRVDVLVSRVVPTLYGYKSFIEKGSALINVLTQGQTLPTWSLAAWQALRVNGIVPGDALNRNRQITLLYATFYNDQTILGADGTSVFKWSGMAALASQLVGSGIAKAAGVFRNVGDPPLAPAPSRGLDLLAKGNLDVFMDMYPQMLAYKSGGLASIQEMLNNNEIKPPQFTAWQQIDQGRIGNLQQVWDGNQGLLKFEQQVTLQTGAYAADLPYWKNVTNTLNWFIPAISSPIPGDDSTFQTFRAQAGVKDQNGDPIAPDVSLGNFNARWAWIMQKQLPTYKPWSVTNPLIDIPKLLSGGYK